MGGEDGGKASVIVHEGTFQRRATGWYDSQVVHCKDDGIEKAWPRVFEDGQAEFELDGKEAVRVFHVDVSCPEFVIPAHVARQFFLDWYRQTKAKALVKENEYDEAVIKQQLEEIQPEKAQRAGILKRMFQGEMRPEDTARIFHRRFLEIFTRRAEAAWPLVVAGVLFGLLEGWQLADTILPDIGKSPWFSTLLPIILILAVVWMAWKER